MYLNDFSVRVSEGKELPGGYVELEHNTQYTLNLRNNRNVMARAEVYVDGKNIGVFRLRPNYTLRLERPAHDKGKFTFYELGTSEARDAQLEDGPDIGLVRVVFTPELKTSVHVWHQYPYWPSQPWITPPPTVPQWQEWNSNVMSTMNTTQSRGLCSPIATASAGGQSAGGTGLSGNSNQKFVSVPDLIVDTSQQTTINLRLVCKSNEGPRPLTAFSTPIPPKV